jgi:hypothetical protein
MFINNRTLALWCVIVGTASGFSTSGKLYVFPKGAQRQNLLSWKKNAITHPRLSNIPSCFLWSKKLDYRPPPELLLFRERYQLDVLLLVVANTKQVVRAQIVLAPIHYHVCVPAAAEQTVLLDFVVAQCCLPIMLPKPILSLQKKK